MARDAERTLAQYRAYHDKVIQPKIDDHRGRLVKAAGDGFLAEFPSTVEALRCVVELQSAVQTLNDAEPEDRRLTYRIGVNIGEIIVEEDDIYGDDVNIAARLEELAEPGGIAISAPAYNSVKRKLDLDIEDAGEYEVKNISDPVHVYRVPPASRDDETGRDVDTGDGRRTGPEGSAMRREGRAKRKALDRPALIVLPFKNLNDDPDQEYFCHGLTMDITTDLSKFRSIFVISSNTAYSLKDRPNGLHTVRQEAGVRYMIEGSIHRARDSFRINVRLIDAEKNFNIWAERFDRGLGDLIKVRDEIVQKIVVLMAFKIDAAERNRVLNKRVVKLNAYEVYLQGIHKFTQGSKEKLLCSRRLFENAVDLDPSFARAWGYLAYTTTRAVLLGWMEPDVIDKAHAYAAKAVALDPDDYANHWDLAFVHLNCDNFSQAINHYKIAVALNPNDADLLAEMAAMLVYAGQPEDGIAQIYRAMAINPFYPDWYRWNLGWAYFNAHQYGEAINEFYQMDERTKHVWLKMAATYARLGEPVLAQKSLERVFEEEPNCSIASLKTRFHFKRLEDKEHWVASLREAGLPESAI